MTRREKLIDNQLREYVCAHNPECSECPICKICKIEDGEEKFKTWLDEEVQE